MTDYARPYAFDLTEAQLELMLALVRAAAKQEHDRAERMAARPRGTHAPATLDAAAVRRHDLHALEAALTVGDLTEPEAPVGPHPETWTHATDADDLDGPGAAICPDCKGTTFWSEAAGQWLHEASDSPCYLNRR